jgi:hypothetical protein
MTASRNQSQRPGRSAKSRAAEKAQLEARLDKVAAWRSLQELRGRKPGKGLMDAIDLLSQRDRLEQELTETSEDYRSWAALTGQAKRPAGEQPQPPSPVFKTRVRVKAGTASGGDQVPVSRQPEQPTAKPADAAPKPPSTAVTPAKPSHGRVVVEEAAVTIVKRAKDGSETRIELSPQGVARTSGRLSDTGTGHTAGPSGSRRT